MAANAWNNVTVGTGESILFQSERDDGSQINGCTKIRVRNDHDSNGMLVNVKGHHATDEWMLLEGNTSADFEIQPGLDSVAQIDRVTVKRSGGGDATSSGGVLGRR